MAKLARHTKRRLMIINKRWPMPDYSMKKITFRFSHSEMQALQRIVQDAIIPGINTHGNFATRLNLILIYGLFTRINNALFFVKPTYSFAFNLAECYGFFLYFNCIDGDTYDELTIKNICAKIHQKLL